MAPHPPSGTHHRGTIPLLTSVCRGSSECHLRLLGPGQGEGSPAPVRRQGPQGQPCQGARREGKLRVRLGGEREHAEHLAAGWCTARLQGGLHGVLLGTYILPTDQSTRALLCSQTSLACSRHATAPSSRSSELSRSASGYRRTTSSSTITGTTINCGCCTTQGQYTIAPR